MRKECSFEYACGSGFAVVWRQCSFAGVGKERRVVSVLKKLSVCGEKCECGRNAVLLVNGFVVLQIECSFFSAQEGCSFAGVRQRV